MVPEAKTSLHRHMAAIHRFPTPNGLNGVAQGPSTAASRKSLPWPASRTAASGRRIHAMAVARSRRNQRKASLSVFRRWEVKVLGFGVKARLRPQRMASRGCFDPFALVGATGKACGEARRVLVSGAPPCVVVAFPVFFVGRSCFVRVSAVFVCRLGSWLLLLLGTVLATRRLDAWCHVGVC